ncbi:MULTISPECIES: SMI1/KNR4 family protein [unclassified Streptomyces]|uniref:SMI1/KNR4 family protein n=1 Tax=unclassified Streptomyces TaxID=2593676 RepID=UPI0022B6D5F9|nr:MULTISPECIES: SMI1/KNR4 family protein [unclassified Streptomyces]MCZ7416996.1 SMI1/KNR4 family protein [Streptomyces sp. WMMC897]MCZ7433176.1 SMI1/KNR4 family protein [Streptomyces sp. WMMC1477]
MMNAVAASERLIELVRGNDDIANHADGCDAGTMAAAESDLGVAFPPSYRRLIEEFGTWDITGEEFLGVYQTLAMGQKLLGSVAETLDARSQYGMPSDLIVVMFDGMGGLVVLDSSQVNQEGEYPVLVWNPGVVDRESMERLGDDFGSFAFALCQRAVTRWRESD